MSNANNKIIIGMSGGVDSSMSALLLKKSGWNPIGISLKFSIWNNECNNECNNETNSAKQNKSNFEYAEKVCKAINIPHYVVDVSQEFQKQVIKYFVSELKKNRTPNPCVICNRYLKFKQLFTIAHNYNAKHISTGHYAKIKKNKQTNQYELHKHKDRKKDQSYFLSFLPKKWLKNIIFPLEKYTKPEIFDLAKKQGFTYFLEKKESQDFCFAAKKNFNAFKEFLLNKKPGLIKDVTGNKLGTHYCIFIQLDKEKEYICQEDLILLLILI